MLGHQVFWYLPQTQWLTTMTTTVSWVKKLSWWVWIHEIKVGWVCSHLGTQGGKSGQEDTHTRVAAGAGCRMGNQLRLLPGGWEPLRLFPFTAWTSSLVAVFLGEALQEQTWQFTETFGNYTASVLSHSVEQGKSCSQHSYKVCFLIQDSVFTGMWWCTPLNPEGRIRSRQISVSSGQPCLHSEFRDS